MDENPRYIPAPEILETASRKLSVRSVPELEHLVETYIEKITGKPWNNPDVLEKIRTAVRAQKDTYWKDGKKRVVTYKGAYSVLAYIAYQMTGYIFEISEYLHTLIASGELRTHLRVLDLGAGPGTASAAVIMTLSRFPGMTAEIHAVERTDTHREAYAYLIPGLASMQNCKSCTVTRPVSMDITETMPEGTYDLIICANVLNELTLDTAGKTTVLMQAANHLSADGSLLVFEPADLENAGNLRNIAQNAKSQGLTLYAPCNDLRGVPCRVSPCWTFQKYTDISPTRLMSALAKGTDDGYRYINTDVKCAYAVFRTDGHRRCGYKIPADAKRARLSQLKQHEGKRIHVTVSVMSADIGDAATYLYLVCDGTGTVPCYLALPAYHRTPEHESLVTASYGSIVAVDSVLVRWNKKENAYNLLMGKNSFCRMIAGTSTGKTCPDKAKALRKPGLKPQKKQTGRIIHKPKKN